ncbi:hypothetical protein C499_11381 [Halogeometricum borinquense DSM 11551]|uniref:Uncharacterized protein n=1 Tax=Halogeometricum borinquense (strain ATCC 700274 / DSM 11551 / JCM 10706 / KCTC 4070 / PR3) TaxID=469382 RepID=E4NSR5_HALBP|nr:hypothetical protein Hbor_01920 [Halogeometricum borinquense DSM 11551]ELY26805.1 hypothetical protein C499_11381 [Halogeometricum borinquense DSM 11551]
MASHRRTISETDFDVGRVLEREIVRLAVNKQLSLLAWY